MRNILKRHGIVPAPERRKSTWRAFIAHHKEQMLACDFFTVETIWLQTIYVLFFIELATRRVHFVGCTAHPNSTWVTQQARQLVWQLEDEERTTRFLIHDRDDKFTHSFDTVMEYEGIDAVETPYRAPKANAYAEHWVHSAREECLIIFSLSANATCTGLCVSTRITSTGRSHTRALTNGCRVQIRVVPQQDPFGDEIFLEASSTTTIDSHHRWHQGSDDIFAPYRDSLAQDGESNPGNRRC